MIWCNLELTPTGYSWPTNKRTIFLHRLKIPYPRELNDNISTHLGDGVLSEILQKISIPIRQLKECAALPGWMESIQKTSRVKMQLDPNVEIGMLCAGGGDYDTCHGELIFLF